MAWKQFLDEVSNRLRKRNLVWLGTRGADAAPLLQLPQFTHVFSATLPLEAAPPVTEVCLETLQKRRVSLYSYDFDQDHSDEAERMHSLLIAAFNKPTAVIAYQPNQFLSTAYLPQAANVQYLNLFHEQRAAFEDKSWVESELRKAGARIVPWRYYSHHQIPEIAKLLRLSPIVVRFGKSSTHHGGVGMTIIHQSDQLDFSKYGQDEIYAISRYLEPNIALNVNACLFQDGSVSLHGPSIQLIGIPSCTSRQLGYCGNDFAQVRKLDSKILDELETLALQVGKWLASKSYKGVFGVDAVMYRDHVYLAEINPRFQGSSLMVAQLDKGLSRPDEFINHIAAFMGMTAPPYIPLRDLAKQQREISQIYCANLNTQAVFYKGTPMGKQNETEFLHLPAPDIEVEPDGMLFRAVVESKVTTDGHSLLKEFDNRISGMIKTFFPRTSL